MIVILRFLLKSFYEWIGYTNEIEYIRTWILVSETWSRNGIRESATFLRIVLAKKRSNLVCRPMIHEWNIFLWSLHRSESTFEILVKNVLNIQRIRGHDEVHIGAKQRTSELEGAATFFQKLSPIVMEARDVLVFCLFFVFKIYFYFHFDHFSTLVFGFHFNHFFSFCSFFFSC